jgi:argininosuccinate synthase
MKQSWIASGVLALAISVLAGETTGTKDAGVEGTQKSLQQLEHAWGKAMVDRDYKKVDEILDDEWAALDAKGRLIKKPQFMADLKAGTTWTTAVEYGPVSVRLYDGFAIVTGSNKETSTFQGKNTTGQYVWIDVHVKRNGRWRILSSQFTKIN